ncbi:MAG: DUF805 domain-containing protein [Bacteroidota bacterium]
MIESYLKVVRDNYANFNGRATRPEYWYFFLVNFVIGFIIGLIAGVVPVAMYISYLYSLAVLVPSIAVAVRRIHDVGKSGWYVLVPIYNIVLLATEGQNGPNEYGPDPRHTYSEFDQIGKPENY